MFRISQWKVKEPIAAPKVQQTVTDIQLSTKGSDFGHERKEILDVRDAFKNAGIKGADRIVCDPSITSDTIVLWVGVKSPDEMPSGLQPPIMSPEVGKLAKDFG
jgi:hypothetical protein